jgi:hypothetical protein
MKDLLNLTTGGPYTYSQSGLTNTLIYFPILCKKNYYMEYYLIMILLMFCHSFLILLLHHIYTKIL